MADPVYQILNHSVPCSVCDELRELTDNGDNTWTVEECTCGGGGPAFTLIDPDLATAKPWWDRLVGGWR